MAKEITVLIVDDHAVVRRGFRYILQEESGIRVVGEAGDGIEAVRMARNLNPRVVLMDCALPGMNGVLATKQITNCCPDTSVLMLSMHSEEGWVRRAMDAGARGYILKNAMNLDLTSAIQRVVAGELVVDSQVAKQSSINDANTAERLTARELEVLQLIVDGKSNKEIAVQLNVSKDTIGTHRANIMKTLGLHKTAELVAYAIRNGLVSIS